MKNKVFKKQKETTKTVINNSMKDSKNKEKVAKYVTIDELDEINKISKKLRYNRTFDIKGMIKDGHLLSNRKDIVYPVQLCMYHENMDGSICSRVYVDTFSNEGRYLLDMPIEIYENLREQSFLLMED